jgi:hypothetical protein
MTIINPTSISGINSITSGTQNRIAFYDVNGGSNLSFLVGSASSTGTASQPLQVTGGAYVSGSLGIGTTNPASTVRLDVVGGIKGTIVQGTSQVSTAGTSIDFTGIPSWVKRVTVMFDGVSTNGTSSPIIQIGAGSVETTGYASGLGFANATGTQIGPLTTGFACGGTQAVNLIYANATLALVGSNLWVYSLAGYLNASGTVYGMSAGGNKTLAGTLDRVRITTVNGTDTFDAGSMNILYEG